MPKQWEGKCGNDGRVWGEEEAGARWNVQLGENVGQMVEIISFMKINALAMEWMIVNGRGGGIEDDKMEIKRYHPYFNENINIPM